MYGRMVSASEALTHHATRFVAAALTFYFFSHNFRNIILYWKIITVLYGVPYKYK